MASRIGKVHPQIREWIKQAESTTGWLVVQRVKAAEFRTPSGESIFVTLDADAKDLRTAQHALERAGLFAPQGETVTVRVAGVKPYMQMSVEERAARVWMKAREECVAHSYPEEVHEGALYYRTERSVVDFIRLVFPEIDRYEDGPRPDDDGQRPIYDHLRCQQLIVRAGQQGLGVLVSDSPNPSAIKREHKARKAAQKRAERPKPAKSGPVVVRRAPEPPRFAVGGLFKKVVPGNRPGNTTVYQIDRMAGRSLHALRVFGDPSIPSSREALSVVLSQFDAEGYVHIQPAELEELNEMVARREAKRRERQQARQAQQPPPVAPVTTVADPEPEPVLEEPEEPQEPEDPYEGVRTALDLLGGEVMRLIARSTVAQEAEATIAELRRELAYAQAQVAHSTHRAERAEAVERAVREAVETMPPGEAYSAIVRVVPPIPSA